MSRSDRNHGKALVALIVLIVTSACASTSGGPAVEPTAAAGPAWPPPPLEARILYTRTLVSEESLDSDTSFGESMFALLTGTPPPKYHVYQPMDLAVSADGQRLYVSDFGQLIVFMFDLENRTVTTITPGERAFARPFGIALDEEENLYVVEQGSAQITVLDREHNVISSFSDPSLVRPADIAVDTARGRIYVADPARQHSEVHNVKVFDTAGNLVDTVGKGRGTCAGCLLFPTYVEVDGDGQLFVTNTLNARIDIFDANGEYVRLVGERGNGFGMFDKPKGVAVDSFGNTYVVDSGWSNVQIFNDAGEVLLFFGGRGSGPGYMHNPTGIAIGPQNRIYVADFLNNRVVAYQLVNTNATDSFLDPNATEQEKDGDQERTVTGENDSRQESATTKQSSDQRSTTSSQGAQR